MYGDRPDAVERRHGVTVRLVQGDQDPRSEDRGPIVDEISREIDEDPEGPEVELLSGVVGHVVAVGLDA